MQQAEQAVTISSISEDKEKLLYIVFGIMRVYESGSLMELFFSIITV